MSKYIPIGKTGRLTLRIGRMTKAEEDAFWRRHGSVVALTRPAPSASSPTLPPAPPGPAPAAPLLDEPPRTIP